jgi:hypothetical protein
VFGVLLAAIGDESQTGTLRWTFGEVYLWEGLPIEAVALGLFALPELIDMAILRMNVGSAQRLEGLFREQMRGVRDVLVNWKVILNSSTIGVVLGSVPGMGSAVIDWIAYGSAARLLKGASETFGKGDVRGLIAAESANNAREGGALVPTLAFGVPSSPSMALLLGAFLAHGIQPGPKLLDSQLDITFTIVWSLALANVVGAGICFLSANPLAKLATLRAGILIPTVFAVCFVGAYQGSRSFGDLVVLIVFGLIGWIMKQYGWARAPLILGYILGKLIEKYLFISVGRYQFEWLSRPAVMAILGITALVLARPLVTAALRYMRGASAPSTETAARAAEYKPEPIERIMGPGLWIVAALGFAAAFYSAVDWRFAARLMPQTAAATGFIVVFCAAALVVAAKLQGRPVTITRASHEVVGAFEGLTEKVVYARFASEVMWLLGLLVGVLVVGMMPAMGLYMFLYMVTAGRTRIVPALLITASLWIGMYALFVKLLHVPWPPSLLGDALPALRDLSRRLI